MAATCDAGGLPSGAVHRPAMPFRSMARQAPSSTVALKAQPCSIQRRIGDADNRSPGRQTSAPSPRATAQIALKPGGGCLVVLEEGRVAVDLGAKAFADHQLRRIGAQIRGGTRRRRCPARNGWATAPAGHRAFRSARRARRPDGWPQKRRDRPGASPASARRSGNSSIKPLIRLMISSPPATASAPPGQKSFCTSITIRASVRGSAWQSPSRFQMPLGKTGASGASSEALEIRRPCGAKTAHADRSPRCIISPGFDDPAALRGPLSGAVPGAGRQGLALAGARGGERHHRRAARGRGRGAGASARAARLRGAGVEGKLTPIQCLSGG